MSVCVSVCVCVCVCAVGRARVDKASEYVQVCASFCDDYLCVQNSVAMYPTNQSKLTGLSVQRLHSFSHHGHTSTQLKQHSDRKPGHQLDVMLTPFGQHNVRHQRPKARPPTQFHAHTIWSTQCTPSATGSQASNSIQCSHHLVNTMYAISDRKPGLQLNSMLTTLANTPPAM